MAFDLSSLWRRCGAENGRAETVRRVGGVELRHECQLAGVAEALFAEGNVLDRGAVQGVTRGDHAVRYGVGADEDSGGRRVVEGGEEGHVAGVVEGGGLKPKEENPPLVSATTVLVPSASIITISSTNCCVGSSKKDLWKTTVPASLRIGTPSPTVGSAATICVNSPSWPTKMPLAKSIDSTKATSPELFIEGLASLPSNWLVEVR